MKSWKEYVQIAKDSPPYNLCTQANVEDSYKKKSKKFYKKNGFRYEEVWNLDYTLASYILPRLAYFREIHSGIPSEFCVMDESGKVVKKLTEEYDKCLDKMIEAFELILGEDDSSTVKEYREREAQIQEGLELFGKYFRTLWD